MPFLFYYYLSHLSPTSHSHPGVSSCSKAAAASVDLAGGGNFRSGENVTGARSVTQGRRPSTSMDILRGPLPSLNAKLADLVAGEYNLRKGEIMAVQSVVQRVMGSLHHISGTPADELPEWVKLFSREVRELSYDLESSVDRFIVRCMADKQVTRRRHKFPEEIRDIKNRIHQLDDRHRHTVQFISYRQKDPRSQSLYVEQERLVGIDSAKAELIKILLEGNESSMKQGNIVSIVGFAGLGKSTLATLLYGQLRQKFDCSAFVSASQTPYLISIFNHLLFGVTGEDIYKQALGVQDLIDKLREFLGQKRYLVIIDDIWNISHWDAIRSALPDNDYGYRIIITTRILNVAEQAGGAYKIRPLSLTDSRRLFLTTAFGGEYKDIFPKKLLEVSEKILEKCDGVPLAIITIASILAGKVNEMEWYKVYKSLGNGGSLDLENSMRYILSLSYNDLPFPLRTCLLYLAVFPENFKIDKARLIWMWIAEGFIQCKEKGEGLFELGEIYFNELINRSMILPVYNNGMIEHCYVQNMVLNLIRRLSSEENFVTIFSDECGSSSERVRRLSLQSGKEDHNITQATRSQPLGSVMQQVRSVIVFPCAVDRMPSFGSLRDLCVLDLNDCDLSQGLNLKDLGSLFFLKYLGLSNTCIAELPEVGNLQFLQTLRVKCNEIANLPSTIVHLKQLMCLQIDMDTRVPNGIANLTSLEELSQIGIYDSADIEALCGLTKLRVLGISCYTECMDSLEKSLVDCLCKLQKVQNLSIWVSSGDFKLDALVVPQHLCRLSLQGCWFSTLPDWLNRSSLMNLSSISIAVIKLQEEDLKSLGRMPALSYLNLKVDHENLGILQRFAIGPGLFEGLVSCVFWGFRGPVIYSQGAMPWLTSLRFTLHVRDMREIPGSSDDGYSLGLENLLVLQDVSVLLRCGGASNEEVEEVKAALRHATKIHPNHPTIKLIGYEDKDE